MQTVVPRLNNRRKMLMFAEKNAFEICLVDCVSALAACYMMEHTLEIEMIHWSPVTKHLVAAACEMQPFILGKRLCLQQRLRRKRIQY